MSDLLVPLLEKSDALQQLKQLQSTLDATNISDVARRFSAANPGAEPFAADLVSEPTVAELTSFVKTYVNDPQAGARSSDAWTLRQREIAFMLSAIFKDCSMIIRAVLPDLESTKVDAARSGVKLIDTDLKPLTNLQKWYQLDEKLWRHWAETRGSEEQTVIIGAEPKDSPHHSYRNLTKTAGGLAAAGVAGGVYAMHGSPNPDDSSARSIASIDAANTALASAIPDASPVSEERSGEQDEIEPEIRAALERFSPDVPEEPERATSASIEPTTREPEAPAVEAIVPAAIVPSTPVSPVSPVEPSKAEAVAEPREKAAEVEAPAAPAEVAKPALVAREVEPVAENVGAVPAAEPEVQAEPVAEKVEAVAPVESKEAEEAVAPATEEKAVPITEEKAAPVTEEKAAPVPEVIEPAEEVPATPAEPVAVEEPSSSTDKKAGFAALAATGVAAGVAAGAAALSKDSRSPSTVRQSPSSTSLSPENTLRRKTSDLEGKSRVARISSLFNRRASQNQTAPVSPTKPLRPVPPPKSPKREKEKDEGFAARFRKPKKSGTSPTTPTAPIAAGGAAAGVAAAAAVISLKEDNPAEPPAELKAVEAVPEVKVAEPVVEAAPEAETVVQAKEAAPEAETTPAIQAALSATEVAEITAEPAPAVEAAPTVEPSPVAETEPAAELEATASLVKEDEEVKANVVPATEAVAVEAASAPVQPVVPAVEATAQPAAEEVAPEPSKEAKKPSTDAEPVVALAPVTETEPEVPAPAELPVPAEAPAPSAEEVKAVPAVEAEVGPKAEASVPVEASAPQLEPPTTVELADEKPSTTVVAPATTEVERSATPAEAPATEDVTSDLSRELSASPHTPAMPIRETFSSAEGTPVSPYTPARLARQVSLTAPKAGQFPRLSAFGDDLRIASPDLAKLRQSPPISTDSPLMEGPTIVPTKSIESPTESPLRKADTAFPRLSAFIDKDTPGIDALRELGETEIPSMPTPIKEESRSLQPSPNVATFADSGAPIKTPPLDAFGITAVPVVPAAEAPSVSQAYDSDASSLQAPSEARLKRSAAPSPSPHLASASTEPFEAELSHVAEEENAEPAADESQLLAETVDLSSPVKVDPTATTPEFVDRYERAALPPLPHMRTESVASVDSIAGSDAFATAPASPLSSTPIISTDSLGLRVVEIAEPSTPRAATRQ